MIAHNLTGNIFEIKQCIGNQGHYVLHELFIGII